MGLVALMLAGAAGCAPPPPSTSPSPSPSPVWIEAGPSFLPNLGVEVGAGTVLARGPLATRALEVHGVWQFLDDEDFLSDGQPKAGPWYQVRGGLRWTFAPEARRHLVGRLGATWLRAEGRPNMLQEQGSYAGVYGGVGFETDLGPRLSLGPQITVVGLTRTNGFSPARPIPQLEWQARLALGESVFREDMRRRREPLPRGEVYGGVMGVASPGYGGGFVAGQVFRRGTRAVWSVEVSAATQPAGRRLFFEEDGRWIQVQGGLRARLAPEARSHWTAGAGVVWLRTTAATHFLEVASDHVGGYVDVGWEVDLAPAVATGPEASLLLVSYEKDLAFRAVPQLRWRVVVRP